MYTSIIGPDASGYLLAWDIFAVVGILCLSGSVLLFAWASWVSWKANRKHEKLKADYADHVSSTNSWRESS